MFEKIAKNTLWLFSGQLIGRLLRAFIVIYAARILGPASWGAFSYAMSLAAFMLIFSDIGVSAIVTKETVRNQNLGQKYFSTALGIKLVLLAIGMAILIFAAPYLTKIPEARPLLPIIALVLLFDSLRNFGFAISRSQEKMKIEGINEIATNFFISALGFAALVLYKNTQALTISYAIAVAIGFLLIAFQLKDYFVKAFGDFDRELVKPLLKTAWPFALASSLGAIMINTDMILIGWLRTTEEVGLYSAAQRPVQLLYVLPSLFAVSLFPVFSRLVKENPPKFKDLLSRSLKIAFLAALPIAILGILFGNNIIQLFFGEQYQNSVLSFQMLLITVLIIFPSAIMNNAALAADLEKNFLWFSLIGAISNLALDILLIPYFGIAGCAAATVITQILANGFMWKKLR